MSASPNTSIDDRSLTTISKGTSYWIGRYWLLILSGLLLIFTGLPWLAPLFMELGWQRASELIYLFYSVQCHQLPQRSFFLFGDNLMLSLSTIQSAWATTDNPLVLRQFIGNHEVGWKVAWSDRMVYMYTSLLIAGVIYWPLRKRLKPLSWRGLLLFLLPMAVDGLTHMASDLSGGVLGGFRASNQWLATLTGGLFPATFYGGDALGSFNSWMRLLSGILFGIGVVWFAYPRIHASFNETMDRTAVDFERGEVTASPEGASERYGS